MGCFWGAQKGMFGVPGVLNVASRYASGDIESSYRAVTAHERAFIGTPRDEKRPGTVVDPVTSAPLCRSNTRFESGTGWPSFVNPLSGAITVHKDSAHGMKRGEVLSARSGILSATSSTTVRRPPTSVTASTARC